VGIAPGLPAPTSAATPARDFACTGSFESRAAWIAQVHSASPSTLRRSSRPDAEDVEYANGEILLAATLLRPAAGQARLRRVRRRVADRAS
jgi:hypothetical protein